MKALKAAQLGIKRLFTAIFSLRILTPSHFIGVSPISNFENWPENQVGLKVKSDPLGQVFKISFIVQVAKSCFWYLKLAF